MKEFGYCVWFIPTNSHPWNTLTEGFKPHVSIKTDFESRKEAQEYLDSIQLKKPIEIYLEPNPMLTEIEGFHAIQYSVKTVEKPPNWWPENAHVSFAYNYKPFTKKEIKKAVESVNIFTAVLHTFVVKKCCGHYSLWDG